MKILLGVCGGIAAYKAAELTRELQRRGAEVQVVMTAGAERFVTPLTFAALSGRQVLTSLWQPSTSETTTNISGAFDIEHIRVAQEVDAVVIAPATANIIAKLAHGITDDLLSTICLATTSPILLAPAMNVNMWNNKATQSNMDTLRERGLHIVAPASGQLACGMEGEGRLADLLQIADAVCNLVQPVQDLVGETLLITAGGTREPIDPVRYIGNRSSGKMGRAFAEAAVARGGQVKLVTTTSISDPKGYEVVEVNTAAEMQDAVLAHLAWASTVIMSAAVSDYRVVQPSAQKLKKQNDLTLQLTQNSDILRQIVLKRHPETLVIGFAAETEHLLEEGRRKLHEKGVDAIVANDVSQQDSGFDVDRNAGHLLMRDEEIVLPSSSKRVMADRILDHLKPLKASRSHAAAKDLATV